MKLIAGLLLCVLAAIGLCTPAVAAAQKPNVIFIMLDDMGPADTGCYGSRVIQTPFIDQLAREGIRFTQAYSGCSVCAPTRSTAHDR